VKPEAADPQAVSLSVSLYALLLAAYPTRFRREYGPHMAQVFRDCSLKAYRTGGLPGMLWLWVLTFFDYLNSMIEEHSQRGVHMTKTKFIRLSGWAFILGAFAWILGWSTGGIQPYNPYDAYSRPIDRYLGYFYNSGEVLVPSALILITLGVLGLYLRYAGQAGRLGKSGLAVAMIGCVVDLSAMVVSLIGIEADYLWGMLMLGIFLTFSGIILFGVAALKTRFLPRWSLTPIFTGLWFPLGFLVSVIYEPLTGETLDSPWLLLPVFLFSGIGLFALGYLLQSDSSAEALPAA
jgi:hypothetical protein